MNQEMVLDICSIEFFICIIYLNFTKWEYIVEHVGDVNR